MGLSGQIEMPELFPMHNIHSSFEWLTPHGQDFVFARATPQCMLDIII
jgi:hypothetical protein